MAGVTSILRLLLVTICLGSQIAAGFDKVCEEHGEHLDQSKDFNEIKFTQTWGHAECLDFKESHGHEAFQCRYEDKPSIFSIHGIWPTQTGTSGPNCCEKVTFDHELIAPIHQKLDLYWYEISAKRDPFEFWGHEWIKHGSCAKILPEFATEFDYFNAGLDLRTKYDLYSALKNASIIPQDLAGKGYSSMEIQGAFRAAFGVGPYVQCLRTKTGDVHLLAVEICLNRNLTPIDCSTHDTRHADQFVGTVGPCQHDHQILYQDPIPSQKEKGEL